MMSLNNILSARKIAQGDLRVGDNIYALHKEPEKVLQVSDSDGDLETTRHFYDPKEFDFYLAERPSTPIPNEAGRVIELTGPNGEKQRWLSWHDFSQNKILWVKASNGTRQSQAFMQGRADDAKSWQVIL